MYGQVYCGRIALRAFLLGGSAMLMLNYLSVGARAQVQLPEVVVSGAKPKPKPRPRRVVVRPAAPAAAAVPATPTPVNAAAAKNDSFDDARRSLYTTIGTTSDTLSHDQIQALPQGTNATVEKVLLQAPGVSQDSAASGSLHVRNDHANVQFRINGVMLPDGVTGFGSILDPSLIGNISLITGALPAEYGMRTVGLVDITTRTDIFNNSGSVSFYGGSQAQIQPSFEYGGTIPNPCSSAPVLTKAGSGAAADCLPGVQYFFTGRYLQTTEGLENALPTYNPIHDFSQQEKGFGYMSMFLDPVTRLTLIAGTSTNWFQVPNVTSAPLNPAMSSAFGITNFNSANLNENQYEDTQFGVLALQRSVNGFDGQVSYFTRYNTLHFVPDPVGDLLLNGIASNISRESFTNGLAGDFSYIINSVHTLRTGFTVSGEQTEVDNTSLVEELGAPGIGTCAAAATGGQCGVEPPFSVTDNVSKVGWLAGVYAQDEWKITRNITINAGLRFDQMWQYVDANQFSPRLGATWKPFEFTTFHAGYARYFTPPVLVEAAPANIALFNGTTGQSANVAAGASAASQTSPMLPERSHYFDAGADQKIPFGCAVLTSPNCSVLELGVDAYYKIAQDLIDNGTFGQALVLSGFNYAKGISEGIEFSLKYHSGNFQAYGNLAVSQEQATDVVSNQYLFDNTIPLADLGGLAEQQYVDAHWIYTDHNQFVTGSAGASYLWYGTRYSVDMIYGSGLRSGDANIDSESPYAQFNVGMSHEFAMPDGKPLTVRFDVVNVLDTIYQIRSGTGIGVFAPQYGPRRGYFVGVSKKI
jgi:outer membrane receptor protein involved in Fe transport